MLATLLLATFLTLEPYAHALSLSPHGHKGASSMSTKISPYLTKVQVTIYMQACDHTDHLIPPL